MSDEKRVLKIGIVVGEASGDILGAGLMEAILKQFPLAEFEGIGGPKMIEKGFNSLFSMERLAVMGFVEPLKRLPEILGIRKSLLKHFLENPPAIFIGIDAPDFNLGLELRLKRGGIKTAHYVSPSVWAWRKGRIHTIKRAVDLMLVLFPFEAKFYEEHGVPVNYVGHPLADSIPFKTDAARAKKALDLDPEKPVLGLLPGSRRMEIAYLAEPFINAALICQKTIPDLQIVAAMFNKAREGEFRAHLAKCAPALSIKTVIGRSHEVMAASDILLITSGTATLEAMLLKKPMIVAYRMAPLNYWLAKMLVKIDHFALPNLVAGKTLVPELLQKEVTPKALSEQVLTLLKDKAARQAMIHEFDALHKELAKDASKQAAKGVLDVIESGGY